MQQNASHVETTGGVVGSYRYGKGLKIFTTVLGVSLLVLAGLILYFSTTLPAHSTGPVTLNTPQGTTLRFNGQVSLLYYTSALLALLGVGVMALYAWHSRYRHSSYELYEKGIAYTTKGQRTFVPFSEIEELYLFGSGQTVFSGMITNLAFRRNASEPFHRVIEPLKDFYNFLQLFRELFLAARKPAVLQTLNSCGTVTFKYIDTAQVWRKRVSGNFLDVKTLPIELSRDYLSVQGNQVSIASLRSIDTSAWSEKVVIKDASGKPVLSTVATGILNMDLFLDTLGMLIQAHAEEPAHSVA